jgi:hypothetical protein
MRLVTLWMVFLSLILTGCGGGSAPAANPAYIIHLTIAPSNSQVNDNTLAYNADALATVTLSGGSVSDVAYPTQIQLVLADPNIMIEDTNHCLSSDARQATCQFTIHNVYAGPNAGTALTDSIEVQATSNNTTILSNASRLILQGHVAHCSDVICLQDLTTINNSSSQSIFNKPGLHQNELEYQLQLSIGNPAKVFAPDTAALEQPFLNLPDNHDLGLLDTHCTDNNLTCTYTLQNENTIDQKQDLSDAVELITATAFLTSQPASQTKSVSSAVSLTLPPMQSCQITDEKEPNIQGISLNSGTLPVYQSGKALTKTDYTLDAINQMYPIQLGAYSITEHHFILQVNEPPYLFTDGANVHIPSVDPVESNYLDHISCEDYNGIHITPFTYPGLTPTVATTQQCYDSYQLRYVYYAVPEGVPPSKNGWPVVIMLHGSDGQDESDENYLTPLDNKNNQPVAGSGTFNVFNNGWDWSSWEVNPINPNPHPKNPDIIPKNIYSYAYYVRMRLIQTWLSRGFAVIVPTTWGAGSFDWWSFEPNYDQPWPFTKESWPLPSQYNNKYTRVNSAITYLKMAYWPGIDKQFFETLMAYINDPAAYDPNAGNLKFDTHNLFLMGYSSGGNMVSRLINEFPSMTYTDKDSHTHVFPKIKGAIILSAGSYACYIKGDNTCPVNAMEERYLDSQSMMSHPPTLIAESLYDDYGGGGPGPVLDPNKFSGSYYYQSYLNLCPSGSACRPSDDVGVGVLDQAKYQPENPIVMIHTNNENIHHYYFPEMVIPSLNLMLKNSCVAKVDQ